MKQANWLQAVLIKESDGKGVHCQEYPLLRVTTRDAEYEFRTERETMYALLVQLLELFPRKS